MVGLPMRRQEVTNPDTLAYEPLTPQQEIAVDLLATGKTVTDTAEALGMTRQTVSEWLNHHPAFQAALAKARQQQTQEVFTFLRACLLEATQRLQKLLSSENEGIAYRAAVSLLDHGLKVVEFQDLEERIRKLEHQLAER